MIRSGGKVTMSCGSYTGKAGSVIAAGSMSISTTDKITLEAGAVFMMPNGKQMKISKECYMKKFEADGDGVLKVTNLDGTISNYNIENNFNYPDDAGSHLIGDSSFEAKAE